MVEHDAASPGCGLGAAAYIDSDALAHNLARVRQLAPRSRVLAVVKADAYGHGLLRAARALAQADGFAVARMSEADRLRGAGFDQRVLLLPGVRARQELERAVVARIDLVVHSFAQLELLEQAPRELAPRLWLKVDSGMHRLGFSPDALEQAYHRACRVTEPGEPVRLMTHLADADQRALTATTDQIRCFDDACAGLQAQRCIANSAGILAWPQARSDWVRPGIMLYGVSPFAGEVGADQGLRPAMSLRSVLMAVKQVPAGGAIGYGGTWVAPADMPVGSVAIGYADGFPRNAANGSVLRIGDRPVRLVGRVSMDTITVDLREALGARSGATVEIWGADNPVERLAARCQTIAYELLCRVGSRVPRLEA